MKLVPVLVIGALVLAGCSGGGTPVANRSSVPAPSGSVPAPSAASTAPAPSPSIPTTGANVLPGAHIPVMPVQAREHTAAGATLFAANIIPAADWAYSTTDSTILKQYYAPACLGCAKSLEIFDSAQRQGLYFRGGHLATKTISSKNELPADGVAVIQVTVAQAKLDTLYGDGSNADAPYPATVAILEYSVTWAGDRWTVSEIRAKRLS